tara:strand:+ start:441 stop:653 length:213 start_codon:yes stop_codon:yes gene_type:complete
MKSYTITEDVLNSIIRYSYNSGVSAEFSSNNNLSIQNIDEVKEFCTGLVSKHDKEVREFRESLDKYNLFI